MSAQATLNDPRSGQFHGMVSGRRELDTAVMVCTAPSEEALVSKTPHYHEHPYFWMLLEGDFDEKVESKIERVYRPFVLTYHPKGEIHSHRRGPKAPQGFGIVMRDDMFERAKQFAPISEEPRVLEGPVFSAIARRMADEFRRTDAASILVLEALCLELIAAASRSQLVEESAPPKWLRAAKDLLHDRSGDNLSLSDLAAAVGIHPVHLGAEFRRHYGCTPGNYLRSLRIERAAGELRDCRLSVGEVALNSGFYDEAHFCKAFKSHTGQTPTQFRNGTF